MSKSFGSKKILDGLSLKIYRGEAVGIIGPSGTGDYREKFTANTKSFCISHSPFVVYNFFMRPLFERKLLVQPDWYKCF